MKHLKSFNEMQMSDLSYDIAKDLLPRFEKMKKEGQKITVPYFEKYMEEKGADSSLYHAVMNTLVSMGFEFDLENQEEEIGEEPFLK